MDDQPFGGKQLARQHTGNHLFHFCFFYYTRSRDDQRHGRLAWRQHLWMQNLADYLGLAKGQIFGVCNRHPFCHCSFYDQYPFCGITHVLFRVVSLSPTGLAILAAYSGGYRKGFLQTEPILQTDHAARHLKHDIYLIAFFA